MAGEFPQSELSRETAIRVYETMGLEMADGRLVKMLRLPQACLYTLGFQAFVFGGSSLVQRTVTVPGWLIWHASGLLLFAVAFATANRMQAFAREWSWPTANYSANIPAKLLFVNACFLPILTSFEVIEHGPSGYAGGELVGSIGSILAIVIARQSELSRQRARNSVARAIALGEKALPFVLFLRPFRVADEVLITERFRTGEMWPAAFDPVSFGTGKDVVLETQLASALDGVPSISLGWPSPISGTGRIETTDQSWLRIFHNLADRANRIVFLPHSSNGTLDELRYLVRSAQPVADAHESEQSHLRKTIFVCPPSDGRLGESWSRTVEAAAALGLKFPPYDALGFMFRCGVTPGEAKVARNDEWSVHEIRAVILEGIQGLAPGLAVARDGTRLTVEDLRLPVVDPEWEELFHQRVPPNLDPFFGPAADPKAKDPLHLVRLGIFTRLALQLALNRVALETVVAIPIALGSLDCSLLLALGVTVGVSAVALVASMRSNQALAVRLLDRWERRDLVASTRESLAPLVRASIRMATAVPMLMLVAHAGAGLLLYLAYQKWSWWGVVALGVALLGLRRVPGVLVFQAVAVISYRRRDRETAGAGA